MRARPTTAALCLLLPLAAACRTLRSEARDPGIGGPGLELAARNSLEDGRALRREGRLEHAESALRRGLRFRPDDPALMWELAEVLEERGSPEAARWRERADRLAPPPPPLPDGALGPSGRGLVVVLVPPESDDSDDRIAPHPWPGGAADLALRERLGVRLPGALVLHADPRGVDEARAWLERLAPRAAISLRVDRAYCGDSVKDGRFAVAQLRVAVDGPGAPLAAPRTRRTVLLEPRLPGGCEREVVARGLEEILALEPVRLALEAEGSADAPSPDAIRALFPGIGLRVAAELRAGRRLLATGHLSAAAEAFARAAALDPEDPGVRTWNTEVELALAMSRDLSGPGGGVSPGDLDPRLSPAQQRALEARLAEERRRRDELLAAVAALEEGSRIPPPHLLEGLHGASLGDALAFGPALARARANGEVEARAAYAPDGTQLVRYYYPIGAGLPVLREEDTDGDGRFDRWVGYAGARRSDVWEDTGGAGQPDVHLVYVGGGERPDRIELDADSDGRPERIFHYAEGALSGESRDTDRDGRLDRFDRFDAEGNLDTSETDLDGDGRVDVRSVYRSGKLVRREISTLGATPFELLN